MSADRISTTRLPVLKSESSESNISTGNNSTRIYTGSKAAMLAQLLVERGFGASILKIESTGDGNYQLTAGYNWDISQGSSSEPPANVHELENNMNHVTVWNNPVLYATFASVFGSVANANAAMGYLQLQVSKFKNDSDQSYTAVAKAEAQINSDWPAATYPTQNALLLNGFRGIALRQIESSIQFDTVYRRRITAASYNQVQASFTGAGKIWTTAEILAFENVPSAWWFQLPSGYLWLKAKPMVSTVAGQKTEINYNYLAVAEAWGLMYQAYGTATLVNF